MMNQRCCCGSIDDCTDCAPHCKGPDCLPLDQGRGIECIDISFTPWETLGQWCVEDNSLFESRIDVYAFPTTVRVFNANPSSMGSTFFDSGEIPVLWRLRVRRISNGLVTQDTYFTTAILSLNVWHCSTNSSSVYCPMVQSSTMEFGSGEPARAFETNGDFYFFGTTIPNVVGPLQCFNGPNDSHRFLRLGDAVAEQPDECGTLDYFYLWRKCGSTETISVDLATRPSSGGANVIYNGDLYVPTGEQTDITPVSVTWTGNSCTEYPVLKSCTTEFRVTYDPASKPSDAITGFFFGQQMYPVAEFSTTSPSPITWSTDPCPGITLVAPARSSGPRQVRANAGKLTTPRKRGLVSESELEAMGADPEQEAQSLKQGGCCDPPRE